MPDLIYFPKEYFFSWNHLTMHVPIQIAIIKITVIINYYLNNESSATYDVMFDFR